MLIHNIAMKIVSNTEDSLTSKNTYLEAILKKWKSISGPEFNKRYENSGPIKSEIDDMEDEEYEQTILSEIIAAYNDWIQSKYTQAVHPEFFFQGLSIDDRISVVDAVINHSKTSYGWYKGDLESNYQKMIKEDFVGEIMNE